jgi:hypothetical protein
MEAHERKITGITNDRTEASDLIRGTYHPRRPISKDHPNCAYSLQRHHDFVH